MSGVQHIVIHLWRQAPVWRATLVAAIVCTVLAVVIVRSGGSSSSVQQAGPAPPAPGSQGTPQPPIQTVPPVDQASAARWRAFVAQIDASQKETREGVGCEKAAQAKETTLQKQDLATVPPHAVDALTRATACGSKLQESDNRLKLLTESAGKATSDRSASIVAELARDYGRITPFDRSRELTSQTANALDAGLKAAQELKQSDQRILDMVAAANDPNSMRLDGYSALRERAEAITGFDRARMTPNQQRALHQAEAMITRIRESDNRLVDLRSAVTLMQRTGNPAARDRLLTAYAALTPFDQERSDAPSIEAVTLARQIVRGSAREALVAAAEKVRGEGGSIEAIDRGSVESVERLVTARRALEDTDLGTLSPSEQKAVELANAAMVALAESDRRLNHLIAAAKAWRADQSMRNKGLVTDAHDTITDFDKKRFTPEHLDAYRQLETAYHIVSPLRDFPPQRKDQIAIYVVAAGGREESALASAFRDDLRRGGFTIAEGREDAAMIVTLQSSSVALRERSGIIGALIDISLSATWAIDGATFLQAEAKGNGASAEADVASRKAIETGAERLFQRFLNHVDSRR